MPVSRVLEMLAGAVVLPPLQVCAGRRSVLSRAGQMVEAGAFNASLFKRRSALGLKKKFRLLTASILVECDQIPIAVGNGELPASVGHHLQGPSDRRFALDD